MYNTVLQQLSERAVCATNTEYIAYSLPIGDRTQHSYTNNQTYRIMKQ